MFAWWPLRRIIRVLWGILTLTVLGTLPWMCVELNRSYNTRTLVWFIAGVFVLLSVPMSMYEVTMHMLNYSKPLLQRHVVRILWMVPIYSIDCWFALRFPSARFYLDPVREFYEAYIIYNFYVFLLQYLKEDCGHNLNTWMATLPQQKHIWGMQHVLAPWPMDTEFLWECRKGVLSYVVMRPLTTLVAIITEAYHTYGDGSWHYAGAYPYLTVANSVAQGWALYCLAIFYVTCHERLEPIKPLKKFVVVKSVVFLSYWQGVLITILVGAGLVLPTGSFQSYDRKEFASMLQNFLVCVEMFVAAMAHAWAFPPKDYQDDSLPSRGLVANLMTMLDVTDVLGDVGGLVDETRVRTQQQVVQGLHTAGRHTVTTATSIAKTPYALAMHLAGRRPLIDREAQMHLLSDDAPSDAPLKEGGGAHGSWGGEPLGGDRPPTDPLQARDMYDPPEDRQRFKQ